MAGSPIYDKMVKEKGFDPHKGSIYDTPTRKKSAPPVKASSVAKKETGIPKSRAQAKQIAKTTKAAAKQTKKGK